VNLSEFMEGCKNMGFPYAAQAQMVFYALDTEKKNFLTLKSFDPEGAQHVRNFRELLLSEYGSYLEAWQRGLDPKHQGRAYMDDLVVCARRMGYLGSVKRIFNYLDGTRQGFITLKEIDPPTWEMFTKEAPRTVGYQKAKIRMMGGSSHSGKRRETVITSLT